MSIIIVLFPEANGRKKAKPSALHSSFAALSELAEYGHLSWWLWLDDWAVPLDGELWTSGMPGSCFLDELLRYLYLRKIGYVYSSSYIMFMVWNKMMMMISLTITWWGCGGRHTLPWSAWVCRAFCWHIRCTWCDWSFFPRGGCRWCSLPWWTWSWKRRRPCGTCFIYFRGRSCIVQWFPVYSYWSSFSSCSWRTR